MPEETSDRLLTTREAAEQLRVKPLTLFRWRKAGTGPSYARVGPKILYRQSDLDQFIEARRVS